MNEKAKLGLAALGGVALTLAGGGVAAALHHHGMGGPGMGRLAQMDADKDGTITKAEWMKAADDRFQQFDTNKDGKLVWSELPKGRGHHRHGGPGMAPDGDAPPPPPPAAPTGNAG